MANYAVPTTTATGASLQPQISKSSQWPLNNNFMMAGKVPNKGKKRKSKRQFTMTRDFTTTNTNQTQMTPVNISGHTKERDSAAKN